MLRCHVTGGVYDNCATAQKAALCLRMLQGVRWRAYNSALDAPLRRFRYAITATSSYATARRVFISVDTSLHATPKESLGIKSSQ